MELISLQSSKSGGFSLDGGGLCGIRCSGAIYGGSCEGAICSGGGDDSGDGRGTRDDAF